MSLTWLFFPDLAMLAQAIWLSSKPWFSLIWDFSIPLHWSDCWLKVDILTDANSSNCAYVPGSGQVPSKWDGQYPTITQDSQLRDHHFLKTRGAMPNHLVMTDKT